MYSKIKHLIIDEYKDFDDDFFINEKKFNEAELSIDEIDISIKNTFEKQHLGLFNAYYVKAKLGQINKNQINKLVIINPYTLGLKYLILALAEKDNIRASELYMKSIENLKHIKYYHIEAIYFYAKHLKSIGCTDYCYWLSNGKELAKKYRYSFHNYKFRCLEHDVTEKFDDNEEIGFIYPELDNYIADVNDYSCSQIENKKKRSIVKNR